jgi:hypothetical protein
VTTDDAYWSLDIPGLTESQADSLIAHAKAQGFGHPEWESPGSVVDPSHALTVHMDAATVRMLARAIEAAGPDVDTGSMSELFEEWLGEHDRER